MTRHKFLATVLGITGGLLLGLGARPGFAQFYYRSCGPAYYYAQGYCYPRLPPPPIVGYPPQIYMNPLPPIVVGPSFDLNFGFRDDEHRAFHRFDRGSGDLRHR